MKLMQFMSYTAIHRPDEENSYRLELDANASPERVA